MTDFLFVTSINENKYQDHFKDLLDKENEDDVKSMSKEKKKKFFKKVDNSWNSKEEPGPDGPVK